MKKILIVEDDPVGRHILHSFLSAHNYEILIAGDAMAAIAEARKHQPHLIILDLGLPAGGGLSVLQRMKAFPALSLVPVVVVSGQDRAKNEPAARAAGATTYLEKPVSNEVILGIVRQLLGDSAPGHF